MMSEAADTAGSGGKLSRHEIAERLRELGTYLRVLGNNRYRARAYERAASAIEAVGPRFDELVASGRLTEVQGVGDSIAGLVRELHDTGASRRLEELRTELPRGLLELVGLPGLTLPRLRTLHERLGVRDVDSLRRVLSEGRVGDLRGFGARTQANIVAALELRERATTRIRLDEARVAGELLVAHLRELAGVSRAAVAGGARRGKETVGTLRLVAAADQPSETLEAFLRWPSLTHVEKRAERWARFRLVGGVMGEVTVTSQADFARGLLFATGSPAHLARLEAIAAERGLVLAELSGGEEAALYGALGLPEIPPELREDEGEIEAALGGDTFDDLVRVEDIRGAVHCHTTFSDGRHTVEEMARAAQALGLEYITITDHSPSAFYAGGLDEAKLALQWQEIAKAETAAGIRILRGTESDILADGELDYAPEVLARFDVIIASVHNRFGLDEARTTRRLVRMMEQPLFKIWGHALGRLLHKRPPMACDVPAVLDAAARSRAAIEINGDPHRLDLEPRWIREARKRGLKFTLSVDAHAAKELGYLQYATAMARRAGVRKHEVLNTLSADAFAATVRPGG